MRMPMAGECMKPWPEKPHATWNPGACAAGPRTRGHGRPAGQAGRGGSPCRTASCTIRTRVVMSNTGSPVAAWMSAR